MQVAVSAESPAMAQEPPAHTFEFRRRRALNWFPLGCTYACLYMGRYNFNVSKGAIGHAFHYDKAQMGIIATAGFWTYALSVLVNGPLADRFGGRRAILLGTAGACVLNLVIGLLFASGYSAHLIASLSFLYALNMYFQSFGALSVVKVNAAWFHVRERGMLGGVFGGMISLGYWLAYGACGWILERFPLWAVYVVPSGVIFTAFAVDSLLVRNRPSDAGHDDFPTGDEGGPLDSSSPRREEAPRAGYRQSAVDEMKAKEPSFFEVVWRVLRHPVIRWLVVAEFCTGIVRQGLMLYFPEYLMEVHGIRAGSPLFQLASIGITVGGIAGALLCGVLSDYVFQSRRPPVAFLFYMAQLVFLLALGFAPSPFFAALLVGVNCTWIFGVHGMLSGTASADFGGKKAAATATGLLDGVQYLGSGLTGFGLGALLDRFHWGIWPICLMPMSMAGGAIMILLWNAKPTGKSAH
jgi:OPA family glycerol-3-phosphate transporter-like MFS transporter